MTEQKDHSFHEHKALHNVGDISMKKALEAVDILAEHDIKGEAAGKLLRRLYDVLKPTQGEKISEGRDVIESQIEELPNSPFIEHDIADLIKQQVEYQAWVGDGYSVHHDVDYRKFTESIIELLKKHML